MPNLQAADLPSLPKRPQDLSSIIQVSIKSPSLHSPHIIPTTPTATVLDLKASIVKEFKVEQSSVKIIYEGRVRGDSEVVGQFLRETNFTVHVVTPEKLVKRTEDKLPKAEIKFEEEKVNVLDTKNTQPEKSVKIEPVFKDINLIGQTVSFSSFLQPGESYSCVVRKYVFL